MMIDYDQYDDADYNDHDHDMIMVVKIINDDGEF